MLWKHYNSEFHMEAEGYHVRHVLKKEEETGKSNGEENIMHAPGDVCEEEVAMGCAADDESNGASQSSENAEGGTQVASYRTCDLDGYGYSSHAFRLIDSVFDIMRGDCADPDGLVDRICSQTHADNTNCEDAADCILWAMDMELEAELQEVDACCLLMGREEIGGYSPIFLHYYVGTSSRTAFICCQKTKPDSPTQSYKGRAEFDARYAGLESVVRRLRSIQRLELMIIGVSGTEDKLSESLAQRLHVPAYTSPPDTAWDCIADTMTCPPLASQSLRKLLDSFGPFLEKNVDLAAMLDDICVLEGHCPLDRELALQKPSMWGKGKYSMVCCFMSRIVPILKWVKDLLGAAKACPNHETYLSKGTLEMLRGIMSVVTGETLIDAAVAADMRHPQFAVGDSVSRAIAAWKAAGIYYQGIRSVLNGHMSKADAAVDQSMVIHLIESVSKHSDLFDWKIHYARREPASEGTLRRKDRFTFSVNISAQDFDMQPESVLRRVHAKLFGEAGLRSQIELFLSQHKLQVAMGRLFDLSTTCLDTRHYEPGLRDPKNLDSGVTITGALPWEADLQLVRDELGASVRDRSNVLNKEAAVDAMCLMRRAAAAIAEQTCSDDRKAWKILFHQLGEKGRSIERFQYPATKWGFELLRTWYTLFPDPDYIPKIETASGLGAERKGD